MRKFLYLPLAALVSLIAGCGGGGGTPSSAIPAIESKPLQTDVPASSYAQGSPEREGFEYLNSIRSQCGFGKLAHNVALDKAAANHARYTLKWVTETNGEHPHLETQGREFFTGVSPSDRAKNAGYASKAAAVLEVGAVGSNVEGKDLRYSPPLTEASYGKGGFKSAVRAWLNTPYHGFGVLAPVVDVGMGSYYRETIDTVAQKQSVWMDSFLLTGYGNYAGGQLPDKSVGIRSFPCEGSVDIRPSFTGEGVPGGVSPLPTSGSSIPQAGDVGPPILVFGKPGQKLSFVAAEIKQVSTGEVFPIYAMRDIDNDPNARTHYIGNDWGYVVTAKPLAFGEKYQVYVKVKSGSETLEKTFTFSTLAPPVTINLNDLSSGK